MSEDIVPTREKDEKLMESEDQYRSLFESSMDGILLTSTDGRIFAANPAACRILGRTEEEICAIGRDGIVDQADSRLHTAIEERTRTGRFTGELAHMRKDGTRFPAEVSTSIFKDRDGRERSCMIIRDISERKHADEIKSYLAAIVESSDDAIIGKTLDGIITAWNHGAETLYGYSADEAKGKHISILIPPNRSDELTKIINAIRRGERVQHYETQRVRKDGTVIEVSLSVSPIRDSTAEIVGASTIAQDITERKQMELEVRQSKERYRFITENMAGSVWLTDMNLKPTYLSPNNARVRGYTLEELYALPLDKQLTPNSLKLAWENFRKALHEENLNTKRVPRTPVTEELEWYRKDGSTFWSENTFSFIRNSKGEPTGILGVGRDITERKRMEEERAEYATRLLALHTHASQVSSAKDLGIIVKCTLDAMEFALGFEHADFLLIENNALRMKGSRGLPVIFPAQPLNGRGLTVKAVKTKNSLRISDTRKEPPMSIPKGTTGQALPPYFRS